MEETRTTGQKTLTPSPLESKRGNIQIIPVEIPRNLPQFYQVSFQIYEGNRSWAPPFFSELKGFFSKKNPFWSHADRRLFLVTKDKEVVGRIAAIIDRLYCKTTGENIGFFGFFECINDYDCAAALLHAAQDWLTSQGMAMMRGPIDGRIDVGSGFLVNGFESPQTLLSTYTPPYYAAFAERFGMKKAKDLLTFAIDLTTPLPSRLEEKARKCRASGVQVRRFHRLRTGKELSWWIDLFLETFQDHWGFVPVSRAEVRTRFGIQQLRWFVDTRLFLVAEIQGTPVAYLWATPEYNQVFRQMQGRLGIPQLLSFLLKQRSITAGKLHLIGIRKDYRDRDIASCLNHAAFVEMQRRGYRSAEVGWIDEENTAARAVMAVAGATVSKVHRVFEKPLQEATHG